MVAAAKLGWVLDAFDFTILLFLIPHLRQVFNVSLPAMTRRHGDRAGQGRRRVVWGIAADRWGGAASYPS